jgi:hypothetical protein
LRESSKPPCAPRVITTARTGNSLSKNSMRAQSASFPRAAVFIAKRSPSFPISCSFALITEVEWQLLSTISRENPRVPLSVLVRRFTSYSNCAFRASRTKRWIASRDRVDR